MLVSVQLLALLMVLKMPAPALPANSVLELAGLIATTSMSSLVTPVLTAVQLVPRLVVL